MTHNESRQKQLGQWFTPAWAAEALIDRHFGHLTASDCVLDPTAGIGNLLLPLPAHVQAFGVEIDPVLADQARARTGRTIITGDFRTVPLPHRPTAVFGNTPFQASLFDSILRRCFELLPRDGLAGFVMPAYFLQTPSAVVRYAARWSMQAELLPRTLFPSLSKPLVFTLFRKSEHKVMVGFCLFEETADIAGMPERYRETLASGAGSVWFSVVDQALAELGGEASLDAIYATVAPRRPTTNPYWKEQIRKTVRRFHKTGPARYARQPAAAPMMAA